jgi:integrase
VKALEKMPGHTRLYRRGDVYYHRASIPADIAATYPKTEETFSLRTKDHADAILKVRVAAVEVDQRFDAHRRWIKAQGQEAVAELTSDQISKIKAVYYHFRLEEDEETRLDGFRSPETPKLTPDRTIADSRYSFGEYTELNDFSQEETRSAYAQGQQDSFFKSEAEEVLTWDGVSINLAKNSPSWPRLIRALQEATIKAAEAIQSRNTGDVVETPERPLADPLMHSQGQLLSDLFAERKSEATRTNKWNTKLQDDYTNWTELFIEVAGDRPILQYKKADGSDFKKLLMALPTNRNKIRATKGKSASEAAATAKQLGLPCLSVPTINKALGRLQATWVWANKQMDEDVPDIFGPMKLEVTTKARDQKDPFSTEQLQQIFQGPLFTGCHSPRRRAKAGSVNMSNTSWFWLPLLGLLTGARLNELCQLRVADMHEQQGVRYLLIREGREDQRVKGHSERSVPIHSALIKLGLWDYYLSRKSAKDDRMFPTLKLDADGYYSDRSSKDFNQYLKSLGAKTSKTSFHSFRHSFKDACRNNGVPSDIADLLQGHSLGGMAGRYGGGKVLLEKLSSELEKVSFPELDFSIINRFSRTSSSEQQ